MKENIVIFTGGYLPAMKYGGPVTSLENFSNYMSENFNIFIIAGDHDFKEKEKLKNIHQGWNKVGTAQVTYIPDEDYTYKKFEKIFISEIKTACMFYISSVYFYKMNFSVIKLAHKYNIPVVLAPRGDLMKNTIFMKSVAKMIKKRTFLEICKLFNVFRNVYFQSTSDEETQGVHKYLGVENKYIFQIPNFPTKRHSRKNFIKKKNTIRIVFISRLMVKKNPITALEAVKKIDDKYSVQFDLFGPKEDKEYWEKCCEKIDGINASKSNISVAYKGALSPMEAKNIYDSYDCLLFPTLSENYGHVIVESLMSECPVIISEGTTPFDDCHMKGGYIADLSASDEFTKYLELIASMDNEEYQDLVSQLRIYTDEKFQIEELKAEYLKMIRMISKSNDNS